MALPQPIQTLGWKQLQVQSKSDSVVMHVLVTRIDSTYRQGWG
jgi:hypothetical protein